MLEDLRSESRSVIGYVRKVRWAAAAVFLLTFLTHGSILFSQRIGIDTDLMMHGEHNFLMIGRQGLVWLAKLLDLDWFNLYYAQVLTFLFLAILPPAYGYLFYRAGGCRDGCAAAGLLMLGVSVVVSPFWTEQMYFLNQSAQVLLGAVLIPAGVLLADQAAEDIRRKWYCAVPAVLLMQLIFSCYQILVVMYVVTVAAVFLFSAGEERYTLRRFCGRMGFHAAFFGIGFLIYTVISKCFFMSGGYYLGDQIAWKTEAPGAVFQHCFSIIGGTLKNNPPYYTGMYGVFCLLFLGLTVYRMAGERRHEGGRMDVPVLLTALFLAVSPYLFLLFYGKELPARVQLVMPLSQGVMLYRVCILIGREEKGASWTKKVPIGAACLILLLGLYKDTVSHLNYCTRFYYTDEWVYQFDLRVTDEVYRDIRDAMEELGLGESFDEIVFLGYPDVPYNPTCIRGDVIGASSYHWDVKTDRPFRDRVVSFFRHTGHPLNVSFSGGQTEYYRANFVADFGQRVDEMPCYPCGGYIRYLSDGNGVGYLIVKLGNDWRPMETDD